MNAADNATVIDLAAARRRPTGERNVARKSDGRRLGHHGNRASDLIKRTVITGFLEVHALGGQVTAEHKHHAAEAAGVSYRQVCRWWSAELAKQVARELAHAGETGHAGCDDAPDPRAVLPRYLYRFAETGRLQLTEAEVAFFARHSTIADAIVAVRADAGSRLRHYADSTLYGAYANIAEPVRVGARKGAKAQRAIEATYPLTGRDRINETWSIDEYDLKLTAHYNGAEVKPKLLVVRERLSGNPLAHLVLPRSANGTDTGRVLAAAALGFTCLHPLDPTRDLRVGGVARLLVSDQGGSFLGEDGVAAARRLGIGMAPVASHQPQANGDHEVMHQMLLRHFVDGAGSRRGWTDRAGNRTDHGVLPFQAVVDEVDACINAIRNTPYSSGVRKGQTRLEVHADGLDDNNVYEGPQLTDADIAEFADVVAENTYDPTRGVFWKTPEHDDPYWLSPELAGAARKGDRITLKRLLDPEVVYAYDDQGRFIGPLLPRDNSDIDDIHEMHADRARRERFTKQRVAEPRARGARLDADAAHIAEAERRDAEAAWNETADALADADSQAHQAEGVDADQSHDAPTAANADVAETADDGHVDDLAARFVRPRHDDGAGRGGGDDDARS